MVKQPENPIAYNKSWVYNIYVICPDAFGYYLTAFPPIGTETQTLLQGHDQPCSSTTCFQTEVPWNKQKGDSKGAVKEQ